jgi:raffinose/stachyose/melibiose transport system permease protein
MNRVERNKLDPGSIGNVLKKKTLSLNRWTILMYLFLGTFVIVQVYPLIYLFLFSLKSNNEIFNGNVIGLPENWLWSNYKLILSNSDMPLYFFNSLIVTSITILGVIILGATAGYAIQRMKWKLNKIVLIIFLLGMMIPIHSALLPLFMILRNFKLLDSYAALIIPYVAFGLPVSIYIFTGFYQSIPFEMEESAFLEGCTIYQSFFHIILPMVKPAIATIAIFTYRSAWNELMFAFTFISKKAFKTIPIGILALNGRYATKWGPIGAALLIAVLPSLLIYLLLSKNVQDSLWAGAVKG